MSYSKTALSMRENHFVLNRIEQIYNCTDSFLELIRFKEIPPKLFQIILEVAHPEAKGHIAQK